MAAKKPPKKNKFPNIRVGYQNVSVDIVSPDDDRRLEDSEGFYLSSQSKIVINDRQCLSEQIATLFHECLHAAFYTYGMRQIIDDKEKEEYVVNTLGCAIVQILKDNPSLIDLVMRHEKN